MAFTIKVNGVPVYTFEEGRVRRVSLQTSQGEAGSAGIDPNQREVNLICELVHPSEQNVVDIERNLVREKQVANFGVEQLEASETTENKGMTPPAGPGPIAESDDPIVPEDDEEPEDISDESEDADLVTFPSFEDIEAE